MDEQNERGAEGDPACWLALWAQRPVLLSIARRRLTSPDEAEDVVADAMVRTFERRIPPAEAGRYCTVVVINLCVDRARSMARLQRVAPLLCDSSLSPAPEEGVLAAVGVTTVRTGIAGLPGRQRAALELRANGAAVTDIATQMSLPYKAVESLLSRGRAALRAHLLAAASALMAVFSLCTRAGPVRTASAFGAVPVSLVLALATQGPQALVVPAEATLPAVVTASLEPAAPVARAREPREALVAAVPGRPRAEPWQTPSVQQPRTRPTVAVAETDAHGVPVSDVVVTQEAADEDLLTSVGRCLAEGPVVNPEEVGCRAEG